jgi:endonuclease-3 related protein
MSGSSSARDRVSALVSVLGERYGPLPWWRAPPGEVMIGAVLVQQTRWENVESAIDRLRSARLLSLEALDRAPAEIVEQSVRCAGFFRVKTRRLKALAGFVLGTYGSIEGMASAPTDELRRGLLGVAGIGEETADAILCYAFGRSSRGSCRARTPGTARPMPISSSTAKGTAARGGARYARS